MSTTIREENSQFVYNDLVGFTANVSFGYTGIVTGELPSVEFQLPLIVKGSEAIGLPMGTTEQRPDGLAIGIPMFRYNTTLQDFEMYFPDSESWHTLRTSNSINYDVLPPDEGDLRTFNPNDYSNDEIARVLATLIKDLS